MGFDDRTNLDLSERIADLVGTGLLEEGTKEHIVAQQVLQHGERSLSPQQIDLWQQNVIPLLEDMLSDEHRFMQRLREDQQHDAINERHYRFTVQKYARDKDGLSLGAPGEKIAARTAKEAAVMVLGHDVATRGNRSDLAAKVYRVGDDFKPVVDIFYHPHNQ